jgi:hypothetical protein
MRVLTLGLAAILAAGCGSSRVYLNRDVATAVVLAPFNDSSDVEAPWKMWKYVEKEVARRGFRLVPHATVEQFYVDKKFRSEPGQIKMYGTDELAKIFNADCVVYSNLAEWGKTTLGVYNAVTVKLEAQICDRNGEEIWKGQGEDGYSQSASSGKGILHSFVGAAATDPEGYAAGAASACFGSLPWAGWDPALPRTPAK